MKEKKKGVNGMSKKSKSTLSIVITITALLTIICALVFPGIILESQTHIESDYTYIFGATSIFGGSITPKGFDLPISLAFNGWSFSTLITTLVIIPLVVIYDRQISSLVISIILSVYSGVVFLLNERLTTEINGAITGFTSYLQTGFGTWVCIGLLSLLVIECLIGIYLIKSDIGRRHH